MNNNIISVEELETWIKCFMDKVSFDGEFYPHMEANDKNAKRLAQSIYSKIENKLINRF